MINYFSTSLRQFVEQLVSKDDWNQENWFNFLEAIRWTVGGHKKDQIFSRTSVFPDVKYKDGLFEMGLNED